MNKKTLAMSVAAALGVSAANVQADYDLDAPLAADTMVYALETLDSTDVTVVGTESYANVMANSGSTAVLDVTADLGVGVSNGEDLFVRYDLTNGAFTGASNLALQVNANANNANIATVQGGTPSSSFVIFQTSANTDIVQTAPLDLTLESLAVGDPSSSIGLQLRVFETLTQAVTEGDALTDLSTGSVPLVSFATGMELTATAATTGNTADVEEDFEAFTNDALSSTLAYIGTASVAAVTGVYSADDGAQVALADMIDDTASDVTITGDFNGASNSINLDNDANCNTALAAITPNADNSASTGITLDGLNAQPALCYVAGGDAVPEGSYTVDITLEAAAATRTNATATLSGTMGAIQHNGTTVELPYLTTFSDYNQRIVMVNRGSQDADYSITDFQTESDTTAVAGTAATGTIPAGGSAVVKVSDVVTLTGKTRTAATVNIVAATGNISVATTQVNLADSSTDTIVLQ
jgi:hypothetical protein